MRRREVGDHAGRLASLTDIPVEQMIRGVRPARLPSVTAARRPSTAPGCCPCPGWHDLPEVAELDLNPVIARPNAIDTKIRLLPRSGIQAQVSRQRSR